jgi:hypothetical protein
MKIALIIYPMIKHAKNWRWRLGYRFVSQMDRQISPTVPAIAARILRIVNAFSSTVWFFAKRPLCLSHRSLTNARSRNTVVTAAPVMNSGFRPKAPTSEM